MMSTLERFSWFALHVRTRYEERVACFLEGKGYELFLPRHTCKKRWSDRIKTVETPLFPGYVFCKFDPLDRLPILKTPGVIQIAGYNRAPVPVEESEVAAIQALVSSGLPNQPWPFLEVGDRVHIESGPLRGHEGILIEFRGSHRLVLSVTLLHRAVAVEIDSASVESIRPSSMGRIERPEVRLRTLPVAV
jgi:transcription antitermination factor NusG